MNAGELVIRVTCSGISLGEEEKSQEQIDFEEAMKELNAIAPGLDKEIWSA